MTESGPAVREIRKVAVIGSGVMGAGIAAQVANAGVPVLLYDLTREMAAAAVARMLETVPAPFMVPANAQRVTPLGTDADLAQLQDCDWIVEAVAERLDVKRVLYAEIEARAPDAIVSSNTSTMCRADLLAGASASFRRRFLITHFFNPPRYMRLLEIVSGDAAREAAEAVARFAGVRLGKSIVWCKDRPGFIANRLGCFWSQAAMAVAFDLGLTVEEADAVMGKSFGIPKTGVFALMDLVGIDLVPQVNASLARALPPGDLFQTVNVPLPFMDRMIAGGLIGRKGKGGFYRINREAGKRKEAIDLNTGAYRPTATMALDAATPLLEQDSKLGRYARRVWAQLFAYAGQLVGDAADDIAAIDAAMRLGYNWQWGPFELMDRIGLPRVQALLRDEGLTAAPILRGQKFYTDGKALAPDGTYRPVVRPEGILLLADVKRNAAPLLCNASAALWDLGDGAACFEIATKMNVIDSDVLDLLDQCVTLAEGGFKALVIGGDGPNTSAGVNLKDVAALIRGGAWQAIEDIVAKGQRVFKRLKYARLPAVGCGHGLALGGGCEILLHCAAIQAHAEANMGLVECSVGLIPGWGGNGELLERLSGDAQAVFGLIASARVSKSAQQARDMGFLRAGDGITMNRDRLLADAKAKALALADGYRPPAPPAFALQASQSLRMAETATAYDRVVASALAGVLTAGGVSEQQLLAAERREFMGLIRRPETLARILHTLDTGKPLRN